MPVRQAYSGAECGGLGGGAASGTTGGKYHPVHAVTGDSEIGRCERRRRRYGVDNAPGRLTPTYREIDGDFAEVADPCPPGARCRVQQTEIANNLRSPVPRACVLAGGLGLRLRPAVGDLPKVLAPVGGRPFLDYILRQLALNAVRHVTVCTGYGADRVEAFLEGQRPGRPEISVSREHRPLGTAGAVREAWAGVEDETMVVLNGDSFFDIPIGELVQAHRAAGASATLAVRRTDEAGRYGTVEVSPDGWVTAFREKAQAGSGLMNGGVYVLDRQALEGLVPGEPASLEKDVFPVLAGGRRVADHGPGGVLAVEFEGFFIDVGIPADYARIDADPSAIHQALGAA